MWDWLDGLGDYAAELGADIIAFLNWLLAELIAVFQFLYALIAAVFNFIWGILQTIWSFLKTLWQAIVKDVLLPIWNAIQKVHAWLENILSPIVHFLQSVRDFLNRWFLAYIKPIISIIATLRHFLEILRSFGIKWAGTLDSILGKIQNDITKTFAKVQGYLNAVIGIVNALADPLGLFRKPTLLMSLRRIAPGLCRGMTGMPLGYYLPNPKQLGLSASGATQFPFNASDPAQNPPPSSYFGGDDGLGDFGGFDFTETPSDDAADGVDPMDYFNDDNYPEPPYTDIADGLSNFVDELLGSSIIQS